ncbi:hypothetical protein D3C81_1366830 [compost metagenome]
MQHQVGLVGSEPLTLQQTKYQSNGIMAVAVTQTQCLAQAGQPSTLLLQPRLLSQYQRQARTALHACSHFAGGRSEDIRRIGFGQLREMASEQRPQRLFAQVSLSKMIQHGRAQLAGLVARGIHWRTQFLATPVEPIGKGRAFSRTVKKGLVLSMHREPLEGVAQRHR